jgi:cytochrome c biogenesis protein CcmG/thiol:disulfide interchange protein DsbE
MNRRALLLAPLGVALLGGGAFYAMLQRMEQGKFDPRGVPTMLMGKRVPPFSLPGQSGPGFSDADLATGRPILVNFFASWCIPCVEEAAVLMDLKREGIPVWGIAYKDKEAAVAAFLSRHGNPYVRTARDEPGLVAIDWGLTGVPETYLIDTQGVVRWHLAGPLTPETVEQELKPLLRKYV